MLQGVQAKKGLGTHMSCIEMHAAGCLETYNKLIGCIVDSSE